MKKPNVWDWFVLGIDIVIAGLLGVIGLLLCILIIPAPVGVGLIVLGMRIPQGRLKKIFRKVDAIAKQQEQEEARQRKADSKRKAEARNQEALDNVTAVPDEELPWLI